jgi:hypothetical protein
MAEAVPRHVEIPDLLARKICHGLFVPEIGKSQSLNKLKLSTASSLNK